MSNFVLSPPGPCASFVPQSLFKSPGGQSRGPPSIPEVASAAFPSYGLGKPPRSPKPTSSKSRAGPQSAASLQNTCSLTVDRFPFLAIGRRELQSAKSDFTSWGSECLAVPVSAAPGIRGITMSVATASQHALRTVKLSEVAGDALQQLLSRPRIDFRSIFDTVGPIIDNVQKRGDGAVRE